MVNYFHVPALEFISCFIPRLDCPLRSLFSSVTTLLAIRNCSVATKVASAEMALLRRQIFSHIEIQREKSPEIDLKPPKNKWDTSEREILCLLKRFYDIDNCDLVALFNHICADTLNEKGFPQGLSANTITTQWHDMKDGSCGYEVWRAVNLGLDLVEARCRYRKQKDTIEDAAVELNITLRLSTQVDASNVKHSRRLGKRVKTIDKIRGVLGEYLTDGKETDSEDEKTRNRLRTHSAGSTLGGLFRTHAYAQMRMPRSAPAGLSSPNATRKLSWTARTGGQVVPLVRRIDESGVKADRMPCLVYRWHCDLSSGVNGCEGFVAGMFRDQKTQIPAPPIGPELIDLALQHLTLMPMCTAFISFFDSMLPVSHVREKTSKAILTMSKALRRALHSSDNAHLTIGLFHGGRVRQVLTV
jgi:hypothetical protein